METRMSRTENAMRNPLRIAGALLAAVCCPLAAAQTSGYVVNHRVCDMATEQSIARSVPIGCEFLDHALGCAASSPLALHLDFQAPAGSKARLQLTNVPPGLQPAVGTQVGTVKRLSDSTIEIVPGLGTVSGFVSDALKVPVAQVTVEVPQQAFAVTPNPWLSGPDSAGQVRLNLRQVVGNYVADETTITHFYYPCVTEKPVDVITLDQLQSNGAVALIDARLAPPGANVGPSCVSYGSYPGVPFIALPNVLARQGCLERVAIYSSRNALVFRKNSADSLGDNLSPFWNDQAGQDLRVPLQGMAQLPIKMWVLQDPVNMEPQALHNLQTATRILQEQFSGLAFAFENIEPKPRNRKLDKAVADSAISCNNFQLLTEVPGFDGQHLNIFYLGVIQGFGVWCGVQGGIGRNLILIGTNAKSRTLTHEIGHALLDSGNHAMPGEGGFSSAHAENLMTYNARGEDLTLGQLFRANLSPDSPANRHGARPLPRAICSANPTSSDSCPELPRDVTPR